MIRSQLRTTPFPYTTLFRSWGLIGPGRHANLVAPAFAATSNGTLIGVVGRELRSEEHTSELQSRRDIVCRLLLEKKNNEKGEVSRVWHDIHVDGNIIV